RARAPLCPYPTLFRSRNVHPPGRNAAMVIRTIALAVATAVALSACAVGPDYRAPVPPDVNLGNAAGNAFAPASPSSSGGRRRGRSEEHTSELQSRENL